MPLNKNEKISKLQTSDIFLKDKKPLQRVLIKISGESLGGEKGQGFDPATIRFVALEIQKMYKLNIQIALVVGGGNIFRGMKSEIFHIDEAKGHMIGMEATNINALVVKEMLASLQVPCEVLSALGETKVYNEYTIENAEKMFEQNKIVLCAGGIGAPFFTTDSAAIVRGLELHCDLVVKATKVDGVYSEDPIKNPKAIKFDKISFKEVIEKDLQVMDKTAFVIAEEHSMPILVLNIFKPDMMLKALQGEKIGTLIS